MSKAGLLIILIFIAGKSYTQNYFVFIQADNKLPFYVRLGSQLYSSSAEGHLILSQLKDSTYSLTFGSPVQAFSEQHFTFSIHHKDLDLQIKDQSDKGWGLYDVQAHEYKIPDSKGGGGGGEEFRSTGIKKDDAFSRMMAGVVRDTAVLYNTYAMEQVLRDSPVLAKKAPAVSSSVAHVPPSVADPSLASNRASSPDSSSFTAVNAVAPAVAVRTDPDTPAASVTSHLPAGTALFRPVRHTDTDSATLTGAIPATASDRLTPDRRAIADSVRTTSVTALIPDHADSNVSAVHSDSGWSAANAGSGLKPRTDSGLSAAPASTVLFRAPADSGAAAVHHNGRVSAGLTNSGITAVYNNTTRTDSGASTTHTDSATAPLYRPIAHAPRSATSGKDSATGPLFRSTGIVKLSERKLTRGLRLVYADHSRGKKADTIIMIIPVDSPVSAGNAVNLPPSRLTHPADTGRLPVPRGHGPHPDSPILNQPVAVYRTTASATNPTETSRLHPVDTPQRRSAKPAVPFVNSDCHNYATDYDVDKLRVKMLESIKDEDRIAIARKVFKTRCFTTRQIRALSEVFTSDAAKFKFFEAAYPFVSDDKFRELSSLLADPVYNNKFHTMTERQ